MLIMTSCIGMQPFYNVNEGMGEKFETDWSKTSMKLGIDSDQASIKMMNKVQGDTESTSM